MKFKKYILFQYAQYYPQGGLCDITESFDSIEGAKTYAHENPDNWSEVVDRDTWEIVWKMTI